VSRLTIFIEMANLYWWETGYRVQQTDVGLSSAISWDFGFIIVLVLSMVSVNMFVAVICDTFGAVREMEGIKTYLGRKTRVELKVVTADGKEAENMGVPVVGRDTCESIKEKIEAVYEVKTYEISVWYGEPDKRKSKEIEDDESVAMYLAIKNDEEQQELKKAAAGVKKMWNDPNPWRHQIISGEDDDGKATYTMVAENIELHHKPPFYYTRWCAKMIAPETVAGGAFDSFVMLFILFNTITLAAEHHGMTEDFVYVLDWCGHLFNLVFTGEMMAKIFGMGLRNYLAVPFNRLDFFIVLSSLMNYMGDVIPFPTKLLRVFRLFRVARVVRILVKYDSMRRLLNTVMGSGVALLNLTLFILFTVTIFAIFGMHLFGDWQGFGYDTVPIRLDHSLDTPRRNFQNFGRAWLMAFQTLTGYDWCNQLYQYMNVAGPLFPVLVYGMCFISTNYVLMNLFIAVILENFEVAEEAKRQLAYEALLEWKRDQLDQKILDHSSRFEEKKEAEEEEEVEPLFEVVGNSCADPCRNVFLWCCRGFRCRDLKKKTPRERREEAADPEDRNGYCCHSPNPNAYCSIERSNDVSLFCFHGETKVREYIYEDEFGDTQREREVYYTNSIRKFFQAVERNKWFERTVMGAIIISSILLAYEGPEFNGQKSLEGLYLFPRESEPGAAYFAEGTGQDIDPHARDGTFCPDVTNCLKITDLLIYLDTCFYIVFMCEFVTKLVNHGFYFTPTSYLADGWNRLDFVVVVFSTMNYIPGQGKSQLGRVFRLGRCLRPLRMVNKNPGLKVIVTAVINSLGTNLAVMGLAFMLFLIFGILGVSLFGGKFWHCTCGDKVGPDVWAEKFPGSIDKAGDGSFEYNGKPNSGWMQNGLGMAADGMNDRLLCLQATYYDSQLRQEMPCEWRNKPYNFDNIGEAMMGMFTAATLAGWTDIMEASLDISGIDMQPVEMATPFAAIYWVLFVFLLAFFITNLFVGVLVDFIAQSDGSALQTEDQQKWTDLKRNITELKPTAATPEPPRDPLRRTCLFLVTSNAWEQTSNICIISNVLVMCCEFQGQPIIFGDIMEVVNMGFLIFFTIEMILKLIGMGPGRYWKDAWNKFDAIVVSSSWLGMILDIQVQVARAFRAFRIVLVLKNAAGLQALFKCLIWAIVPSINIAALLFLHFSLFSILGMQIFGDAGPHFDEVPRIFPDKETGMHRAYRLAEFGQVQQAEETNFKTFFGTMRLLVECASGKDWKIVMYEIYPVVPGFAFFYFFLHYFFAVYILLNLFVAVIIDQYGSSLRELPVSRKNMEVFQSMWQAHSIALRQTDPRMEQLFQAMAMKGDGALDYIIAGDKEDRFKYLKALLQDIGRMKVSVAFIFCTPIGSA
jgi:hypothetical protein